MDTPSATKAGPVWRPPTAAAISAEVHSGSATTAPLGERQAGRRRVVERMDHAGDVLTLLVALAGDDENVAIVQQARGGSDRLAPPRDLPETGRPRHDLGANTLGSFAARIVVGDDGDIGHVRGDDAHLRVLAPRALP